jgi:phospholipase C
MSAGLDPLDLLDGITIVEGFAVEPAIERVASARAAMYVVSPWSTGGWVCSETFDHTSILRFMEQRFGIAEPQITAWRRTVAGDPMSAFDFGKRTGAIPPLPSTGGYAPPDRERHDTYFPDPPVTGSVPAQEAGLRPARPIGYDLALEEVPGAEAVAVEFVNTGSLGAHFQARDCWPRLRHLTATPSVRVRRCARRGP